MSRADIAFFTVTPGVYTNNQALAFSEGPVHPNNSLVLSNTALQFSVDVYRRLELILNFTASESNTYIRLRNNGSTIVESFLIANSGTIVFPWYRLTGSGSGNRHTWTVQTTGSGITVTSGVLGVDYAGWPAA